ncbi:MAG: CHASE sensor domain-containing protein, partial [Pirellulales bacterium]
MKIFRNATVNNKLSLLMATSSAVALLLSTVAFAYHEIQQVRENTIKQLSAVADVAAATAQRAMAERDHPLAAETLAQLRYLSMLEAATIFAADGSVVASFDNRNPPRGQPPTNADQL